MSNGSEISSSNTVKREIPRFTEDCVSERDCSRLRETDCQLFEQKLKNTVLSLKLWIVISVVMFLLASGGSFVCAVKTAGRIEEKIEQLEDRTKSLDSQVEQLRIEVYKTRRIGESNGRNQESIPSRTDEPDRTASR